MKTSKLLSVLLSGNNIKNIFIDKNFFFIFYIILTFK